MNRTTYILKSQSGQAVLAADTLARARELRDQRASHPKGGVKLRIFEVQTIEREVA